MSDDFGVLDCTVPDLEKEGATDTDSSAEKFNKGCLILGTYGYRVRVGTDLDTCGLIVEHLREPSFKLKGVKVPKGFKVWQRVSTSDSNFCSAVCDIEHHGEDLFKFWKPLVGSDSRKTSLLYAYAHGLRVQEELDYEQNKTRPFEQEISLDGYNNHTDELYPRAWIPPATWFSEEVRKITIGDVLTIFPEAEGRLLATIIGRAIVGRDRSIHLNGDLIRHTFRTMGVIVGESAGIGKSKLFEEIWGAASLLGYEQDTPPERGFNWAKPLQAHVIYQDDCNSAGLRTLCKSALFKQIVTGAPVKTEDKGVNAARTHPMGVVLVNTNTKDLTLQYDLDPGIIDRIRFLETLHEHEIPSAQVPEMSQGSPDKCALYHVQWLANKVGADLETVYMWFLRLCADLFLEAIRGGHVEGDSRNSLHRWVDELTSELRMVFSPNLLQEVVYYLVFLYHCSKGSARRKGRPDHLCFGISDPEDFDWAMLMSKVLGPSGGVQYVRSINKYLEQHWIDSGKPSEHPWIGCLGIQVGSLPDFYTSCLEHTTKSPLVDRTSKPFHLLASYYGQPFMVKHTHVTKAITDLQRSWVVLAVHLADAVEHIFETCDTELQEWFDK